MTARPSRSPLASAVLALILAACGGGGGGGDASEPGIRIDQVGYAPGTRKTAVVVGSAATTFQVVDDATGSKIGGARALGPARSFASSGEGVRIADFSDLEAEGTYHLLVPDLAPSRSFSIAASVFRAPSLATLKAFYHWRASTEIDAAHGGVWARAAGHFNIGLGFMDESFDPAGPRATAATTWDAPKGWYDAGDYGEYVVNAGITVGSMLALRELEPGLDFEEATGIPESGAGRDDLLEEVRWELEWLLAMQDEDGGVFFKIAGRWWPGWVMPEADPTPRVVIGKSTSAALDFAAVMAMAGRVYRSYDASLASACWAAARRAWTWAGAHVDVRVPRDVTPEADLGSGPYADAHLSDEFTWAAAELYVTSVARGAEDASYLRDADLHAALASPHLDGYASWADVKNLAYHSLAVSGVLGDAATAAIRAAVLANADALLATMDSNPYAFPLSGFSWGSAAQVANAGVELLYASRFATGAAALAYRDGAVQTADWVLGKNTLDTTFVTGIGQRSPLYPHHRMSQADGVVAPVPGLVVGGPNSGRQDQGDGDPPIVYPGACSAQHPVHCWLDSFGSWASNEPAINQNAAVFFLLAGLDAELGGDR